MCAAELAAQVSPQVYTVKCVAISYTRSELASLALSLYVCLSGMDDIIIMHLHCTVPRALAVLYCTCSDLQFMFILLLVYTTGKKCLNSVVITSKMDV